MSHLRSNEAPVLGRGLLANLRLQRPALARRR